MPVIRFDDGTVQASRTVCCRACAATIKLTIEAGVSADAGSPGPALLGAMDGALVKTSKALGWANLDKSLLADCPRCKEG